MISVNARYISNKNTYSKIICGIVSIFLLFIVINNAKADEIPFRVMHHQVEISGFNFILKQLKVNIGDTITWTNKDIVPHNIIDSINQKLISPDLSTGEMFTFVVKDSMLYECGLHPSMKGTISLIDLP